MAENNQTQAPTGPRQEAPPRATEASRDNANDKKRGKEPSPWLEVPEWIRQRPWPVLLFAGLFVLAVLTWAADSCLPECQPPAGRPDYVLPVATMVWIALLFAWFIDCFTGEPYDKRTKAI